MYTPFHISQWYHTTYSCAIVIFERRDLEHPVVWILHIRVQRGVPFDVCKVAGNIYSRLKETGMEAFRNAENDLDAHHTIAFE
jgi:hypothetical protein